MLLTGNYPDCDIKLCDFGISRVIRSGIEVREILGTPDYVGKISVFSSFLLVFDYDFFSILVCFIAAPEVLSYEPISLATDIW